MGDEEEGHEQMGLGLKTTIVRYGYGYPLEGLIDWRLLGFTSAEIAEAFPHPSRVLTIIVARPMDTQRLKTLFEQIDFVIGRLRMEGEEEIQNVQLDWVALKLVIQYHVDVTVEVIRGPYKYRNK